MRKKVLLASLILITIALGFIRDQIFIPLNDIIDKGGDVGGKLILLKWVLTAVFSILYLGSTGVVLYLLFGSIKYVVLATIMYGLLLAVSLVFSCIGLIFFTFQDVYPFVRALMGIAQSPLILMILIAACYVNEKLIVHK